MGMVYLERRKIRKTSHRSYIFILPKLWVRNYYPHLPESDEVIVAVGKVIVIMPKTLPQDEIMRVKKLIEKINKYSVRG